MELQSPTNRHSLYLSKPKSKFRRDHKQDVRYGEVRTYESNNDDEHMCTLGQFWNVVCTFGGAGNLRLKAMNVMCFAADRTIIW